MLVAQTIREAQFQAAWYLSVIVAAMLFLTLLGGAWGVRGGVRVWRGGDRGAGAVIAAASVTAVLGLVGMLIAGAVALVRTGGFG